MSPTLPPARIRDLLRPFLPEMSGTADSGDLVSRLAAYLDLLLRWNERVNLTAIRDPEEIVTRHFGESLFAGKHLPSGGSLLDLGSGAGFPGLPIQLLHPGLQVTLAESNGRKAAFLREAARVLQLSTVIWARRAEDFPLGTGFDCVSLRAVDGMADAIRTGAGLARTTLCVLTGEHADEVVAVATEFSFRAERLPCSDKRWLLLGTRRRDDVPRGTTVPVE